jgi:hypothetical protein
MSDSQADRFRFGDRLTPAQGVNNALRLIHIALVGDAAQIAGEVVELAAPMTLRAAVELAAASAHMAAQGLGVEAAEILARAGESVLRSLESPGSIDIRDQADRRGDALLSQAGGASLPRSEGEHGQP